jgi:hypothetical protein
MQLNECGERFLFPSLKKKKKKQLQQMVWRELLQREHEKRGVHHQRRGSEAAVARWPFTDVFLSFAVFSLHWSPSHDAFAQHPIFLFVLPFTLYPSLDTQTSKQTYSSMYFHYYFLLCLVFIVSTLRTAFAKCTVQK